MELDVVLQTVFLVMKLSSCWRLFVTLPCFCCCAHMIVYSHDNRYVLVETVAVSVISLECTCLLTFLRTERENVTLFSYT